MCQERGEGPHRQDWTSCSAIGASGDTGSRNAAPDALCVRLNLPCSGVRIPTAEVWSNKWRAEGRIDAELSEKMCQLALIIGTSYNAQ